MIEDDNSKEAGNELKELAAVAPGMQIAPAEGVAAIALSLSMKYHDINTVQDGALYQQYKLEGKNMTGLHLDMVLDTAGRLEAWLIGAPERMAKIILGGDPAEHPQSNDVTFAESDYDPLADADEVEGSN